MRRAGMQMKQNFIIDRFNRQPFFNCDFFAGFIFRSQPEVSFRGLYSFAFDLAQGGVQNNFIAAENGSVGPIISGPGRGRLRQYAPNQGVPALGGGRAP